MILKIVAEQNSVIIDEFETLKKDIKESFEYLVGMLEETVGGINTNNKCKVLCDVMKIYSKVSKLKVKSKAQN